MYACALRTVKNDPALQSVQWRRERWGAQPLAGLGSGRCRDGRLRRERVRPRLAASCLELIHASSPGRFLSSSAIPSLSMNGHQWYQQSQPEYPRSQQRAYPPPNTTGPAGPVQTMQPQIQAQQGIDSVHDARRLLASYPLASATPTSHGTCL